MRWPESKVSLIWRHTFLAYDIAIERVNRSVTLSLSQNSELFRHLRSAVILRSKKIQNSQNKQRSDKSRVDFALPLKKLSLIFEYM